MIYLVVSIIAGEVILYFVLMAANRDHSTRPASLGWFYLLLCVGLFSMSGASLLAYLDTAHKLKVLDAAGVRYLAVRDVLGSLKDMEIGQRGFLLTGRPSYAEPYRVALAVLPKQANAVRLAYADSGDEARIEDLIKLAGIKVEELRKSFELREQGKTDEALAVLESDRGKNTMDLFRISADELAKKNKSSYNATKADLRQLAAARIWMAMSVMAGAVLQMVLVAFGRKRLARVPA